MLNDTNIAKVIWSYYYRSCLYILFFVGLLFYLVLFFLVEFTRYGCLHCICVCVKCWGYSEVCWSSKFGTRNTSKFLNLFLVPIFLCPCTRLLNVLSLICFSSMVNTGYKWLILLVLLCYRLCLETRVEFVNYTMAIGYWFLRLRINCISPPSLLSIFTSILCNFVWIHWTLNFHFVVQYASSIKINS